MYHHVNSDSRSDFVPATSVMGAGGHGLAVASGSLLDCQPPEKPPLTNRGALITVPLANRFLIDWASFTFKLKDPQEVISIIGLKHALFNELDAGMHGYRKSLRYGNIGIFYDGQENMGCHVSMTGQGCRQYEGQFEENPWLSLFTTVLTHKAKFTRLDLAHDNVEGELDLAKLKDAIITHHIRSCFRQASENISFTLSREESQTDDSHTIYFGKRSSRVFMRFYDKAAQMGTPLPWVRAEIELKDKRAQKAVELLVSGVPVGELFAGVLNKYLAVINLDDSNISRCTLQAWWAAWLNSTEKIRLTTSKALKTVEEAMEHVTKQYSPTIAMIKTYLGVAPFHDFLNNMIEDGKRRMTMKHEKIMFLSTQQKADNYNRNDEYEERAAIMEYDGGLNRKEAEQAARLHLDSEDQP